MFEPYELWAVFKDNKLFALATKPEHLATWKGPEYRLVKVKVEALTNGS